MCSKGTGEPVRISPRILGAIESMEEKGLLSVVRNNPDRGISLLLTHLRMEFEKTQDESYRLAYEWIMRHRDQFLWGVRDGFVAG